ncbi:MAG: hypothetical protein KatS3mg015_1952 [Fimbriimonadales bacterium]|nr:MAG: hypothetical protein KatS3mg015_1952 [Fimbriimonadales bacterium]
MSCNSNPISIVEMGWGGEVPNATLIRADETSPALFVSNAPEQVGEGDPTAPKSWVFGGGPWNLCRAHLTGSEVPTKVRVFFWHVSRLTVPSYWAVIVGSNAPGLTVANLKGQVANERTGNLAQHGMCFADAQLFASLDAMQVVGQAGAEIVVWKASVPAGTTEAGLFQFIACVLEFDVTASDFTIRSVVSKNDGAFGDYNTQLAPPWNNWPPSSDPPTHVRGYWLESKLFLDLPGVFDCALVQPPPNFVEYDFCSNTGAERAYYNESTSKAEGSTDNPAAYGANLSYTGHYKNSGDVPARLYVGMRARNTGAKYFGAGRIVVPATALKRKLPPIPSSANPNERGYDLTSVYPEPSPTGHISVPADNVERQVEILLANGGGCATPANILLSRDGIWPAPLP